MGYFANGTEGEIYEAKYCNRCIHNDYDERLCAVWIAHIRYSYSECNNPKSILSVLIPSSPDGPGNGQCKMFIVDTE